jgi:hypothetical protein
MVKPMKHHIEFRDERVQSIAESLFTPAQLRFLMVSKVLPVGPQNVEQREAADLAVREAEADVARAKSLLALTDMAVALNGGSYDKILRYSDSPEEA